jgi:hypothetical protein
MGSPGAAPVGTRPGKRDPNLPTAETATLHCFDSEFEIVYRSQARFARLWPGIRESRGARGGTGED